MRRLPAIVACRGERLVGTVHEPARDAARTALLLLNPGPAPRAGNGDLSARLGDALARAGVRVFRFDQSGTGDATGESWRTLGDCRAESQRGERPVVEVGAMIDAILARDDTDGVIVGGLCAGATIAMRAADSRHAGIAGVVVLEPDLRRKASEDSIRSRIRARGRAIRRGLASLPWAGSLLVALLARVRRHAGSALSHASPIRDPLDPRVIDAWRRTLARGTPVLAVTALGLDADRDLDELLATLDGTTAARGVAGLVDRRRIPDANHLFTMPGGVERVIAAISAWRSMPSREAPRHAATDHPSTSAA